MAVLFTWMGWKINNYIEYFRKYAILFVCENLIQQLNVLEYIAL